MSHEQVAKEQRTRSPHRAMAVVLTLVLLLLWPPPSPAADGQILIYYNAHESKGAQSLTEQSRHPLLAGALIDVGWAETEPARGKFDWSSIEKKLSLWSAGGKPAILKIRPYNQNPIARDSNVDNNATPRWVYSAGVPRITFNSGGGGKGARVSVPKVWDPAFYGLYEEYVQALAAKFGSDARVSGIKIGVGHNGNSIAQGSRDGTVAFKRAGWTLPIWEEHTTRVIDMYVKHFGTKRLMLRFTQKFLRDSPVSANPAVARRLLQHAAERRVSLLFGGLSPKAGKFQKTGFPQLISYLATLKLPPEFAFGLTDDWPLWVPPARSSKCPSPSCGRDLQGLRTELRSALDLSSGIGKKIPMFFVFLEPETAATNPNDRQFDKAVYDMVVASLSGEPGQLGEPAQPSGEPHPGRGSKRHGKRQEKNSQ
jgi:hypothetical protein